MASWALKETDTNSTTFDWVICLDFKGNFPQYIVNKVSFNFSIETTFFFNDKFASDPEYTL